MIQNCVLNLIILLIIAVGNSSGSSYKLNWYQNKVAALQKIDGNKFYDNGARIIGGRPAMPGEIKGIVSIQLVTGYHYCGGTLINPNHVLTAAHCLIINGTSPYPLEIIRIVGDDLLIYPPASNRQSRIISTIYYHANFDEKNYAFDIGIIKVMEPFVITPTFATVPLSSSTPADNEDSVVAGWGVIEYGQTLGSNVLLKVDINIINRNICNERFGNSLPAYTICAGYMNGGKDACQGDSGGPLMCGNNICGIVSFGNKCGLPNYPGVYTDVSVYVSWIQHIIYGTISEKHQITRLDNYFDNMEIK